MPSLDSPALDHGVGVGVGRIAAIPGVHMWEVLAELAGVGGTALVGAMVTDAWQTTRSGVVRGGPVVRSFGRCEPARRAGVGG